MVKAVIFDFDNTLMDFMKMKRTAVEAAVDAMLDAGLQGEKQTLLDKIYGVYWQEGIEDQQVFDKVLLQELGQIDYRILASGILGYRRAREGTMTLYPHVLLTLTELIRRGIRMAIVSDAPRLPVWLRICGLGLQHFFEHVVTYEDVGEKKPSPKPFQRALALLEIQPREALMVGDWAERDVAGARALGMTTVFARYGDTRGTVHSGADYEIQDIMELLRLVVPGKG
ncbi:MAG: HAD-IA family hydrolase [Elusimicrobia bacterium]|nr:HAD-IA family hydrolase [Elusimicrobiota bacterium]